MRRTQYYAYFDRQLDGLTEIDPEFRTALKLHWEGHFEEALKSYEQCFDLLKASDHTQFELAYADYILLKVKIGKVFPASLDIRQFADPNAKLVLHYARFYWAFWTDHSLANQSLWKLLGLSLSSSCNNFFWTTIFLLAHLSTISGKFKWSSWVEKFVYRRLVRKMKSGELWPQMSRNVILASYPYNRFVAGEIEGEELERAIYFAEEKLPQHDHFYQSLLLISGLYGFAYSGNIARTEVYSERFQRLHAKGQLKRYQSLSQIIVLLPFALRGYGHLVRGRFLTMVEQYDSKNASTLTNSQFYRVCAVISLLLGHNDNALKYIENSSSELRLTKSFKFWLAFDQRIAAFARRSTSFDPSQDQLLRSHTRFRSPPQLGPMLLDFIAMLPDSFRHGKPWLIDQIKDQLCDHLNWSNVKMTDNLDEVSIQNPVIAIDKVFLEFLSVPADNLHYLREILSSISPAIHTCMRAYQDLAKAQDVKEAAIIGELASAVAHNILSPVDVLEALLPYVKTSEENKKVMIRNLISRIKSVANGLLQKKNALKQATSEQPARVGDLEKHLIAATIDNVVTEKRVQYAKLGAIDIRWSVSDQSYGIFSSFNETEMEMILSNIVNNSVEAIRSQENNPRGYIDISLSQEGENSLIRISDNGPGIPQSVIGKVTDKDFSHEKPEGNGVGLYHAKQYVEAWGGSISISSLTRHTAVELRLPKQSSPSWFVEAIYLKVGTLVCILDDDEAVHQVWRSRLANLTSSLHHFYTIRDFEEWFALRGPDPHEALYLIDYELGENDQLAIRAQTESGPRNGIDLVEHLKIANESILVSSHFRDDDIVKKAGQLDIQVLPKNLAAYIPIHLLRQEAKYILIDDDQLIRDAWSLAAKGEGFDILTFGSPAQFLKQERDISRATPVFIDSNLGNGEKGEDFAICAHDLGFETIFITTARQECEISLPHFVKGIVGKRSPWKTDAWAIVGRVPNLASPRGKTVIDHKMSLGR